MIPERMNFILLPSWVPSVMYVVAGLTAVLFVYGIYRRFKAFELSFGDLKGMLCADKRGSVGRFVKRVLAQLKVLGDPSGGIPHALFFYGMLVLALGTFTVFLDSDILEHLGARILMGASYLIFELLMDLAGALTLTGLVIAAVRRFILRPKRLKTSTEDVIILLGLLYVVCSGYLLEAIRLKLVPVSYAGWSFLGDVLSSFVDPRIARLVYVPLWWTHILAAFILMAYIGFSKLNHILTMALSEMVSPDLPIPGLSTPFNLLDLMKGGEEEIKQGVYVKEDLSPLRRLNIAACVSCGRCHEVCPARTAGRSLSPRDFVGDLQFMFIRGEEDQLMDRMDEEVVWSCTTCAACTCVCPAMVNIPDILVDLRRALVAENRIDSKKRDLLYNISTKGNTMGLPQVERQRWLSDVLTPAEERDFDYLYWIGCQASYDPRTKKIVDAMIRIMRKAGIKFVVLKGEERCCGEPVRKLGEEGRFQEIVLENIELFKAYGVKEIVVHCPHGYNTFKNEYREFGAEFEVISHVELILRLLKEGRIRVRRVKGRKAVYHDPCNLARYNGIYEAPREVLRILGVEVVEPERSGVDTFCCGAGGANYWYEVKEEKAISKIRLEQLTSKHGEILTACPFCMAMLEDAARSTGVDEKVKVMDLAELVAELLE